MNKFSLPLQIRPTHALAPVVAMLAISVALNPKALAAVEFACGTLIQGGSFVASSARFTCGNETRVTGVAADGTQTVVCMYQAGCIPATRELKEMVQEQKGSKPWAQLTDDEINRSILTAVAERRIDPVSDLESVAIQCLGTRSADGEVNCPKVNECINNTKSMSALLWQVKPMSRTSMAPRTENSKGFRLIKDGNTAPVAAPKGVQN